jgi:hypothetical protein
MGHAGSSDDDVDDNHHVLTLGVKGWLMGQMTQHCTKKKVHMRYIK